ncbi:hypothetical protein ILUMI_03680 [Ignelater luminosus]|uniref:Microtubule-associated protein futsch n=1 Tax=Ignelater luminosus TaxID=2038154 RepID=A0A8K0GK86_IGNLU|nr:hypothetical protein ILUMI_03680 [Ignelater luminosus]
MEAVNGVSEVDKGGPPAPSPLTGCYLLIVVGEPHSKEHKDIILRRIAKGLLSWDVSDCHVDLEKELAIITEQAPEGEDARYGERLIQFASENLVTEILIHPAISTLSQCMKNLLSSFTRHRHIIHAGYTFAANGSWILQDGTFSLTDFSEAFQEIEVQRVLRAYDNTITLDIHCSPEGDWTRLPKESFTKNCKVRINPDDVLTSGSPSIVNFLNYISPFLVPTDIETLLESSDVVGNIRFSHPTLYVFPGGQGDAALFGINGFNMLVDGGFARKACFWDFVRHLDRLDAVLLTRLNNSNVNGISSVLRRKRFNTVYPQIGHFFCNIQERKAILSPDGDKDKDPLIVNLLEEGQEIVNNLRQLHLQPQACYRDVEPINLYHKVGHGTLDMYVLSPAKESKEVREFIQKWNTNDQRLFANQRNGREFTFPIQNLVSICALLVWQPANANDSITRILFPGSTPQHKIFEGLDRLKQLECIKYPSCSAKTLTPSLIKSKQTKADRIIQEQKEKTKEKVVQQAEGKIKAENKIVEENIKNIQANGVTTDQLIGVKIIKKHDSTESEKSGPQSGDIKKMETKEAPLTNGKPSEDKSVEKAKPKHKPEQKAKVESKVSKQTRSIERKPKPLPDKKASPTTPKKTIESKLNGDAPPRLRTITKVSPSATPAKSAKEANNRKVVESKYKVPPKKDTPKADKKEVKQERKPISRRPKETSPISKAPESPVKKLNELQKVEARKSKLEKEGTTDSSTVSTPSADVETTMKKDISKLTPEELEQLKDRELAELKEEQEVVKEIEAVFRKSEQKVGDDSDLRKVKSSSVDDKTEGEEYLIIEKEEVEHDSLDEKDTKESETQKHLRDSEESEKQRKLSGEITVEVKDVKEEKPVEVTEETVKRDDAQIIVPAEETTTVKEDKEPPKEPSKEVSKEISVTSPDEKVDVSSGKKITDREDEENKEINILESQPDEKFSTPIESGATTAPTLPEDERIPLDEIKEDNGDQVIEEKYVKEDTKEKEIPVVQLPPKTTEPAKIPSVVGIRLDKQTPIRDLVKTPDEVADLPVHEEVDIENYEHYQATQGHAPKQDEAKQVDTIKETTKTEQTEKEPKAKPSEKAVETIEEKKTEEKDKTPEKVEIKEEVVTEEKKTEPKAKDEKVDDVIKDSETTTLEQKVEETIVETHEEVKATLQQETPAKVSDEKVQEKEIKDDEGKLEKQEQAEEKVDTEEKAPVLEKSEEREAVLEKVDTEKRIVDVDEFKKEETTEKVDIEKKVADLEKSEEHEKTTEKVDVEKKTTDLKISEKPAQAAEKVDTEKKTSDLEKSEEHEPVEKIDTEEETPVLEKSQEHKKPEEKVDIAEKQAIDLAKSAEQEQVAEKVDAEKQVTVVEKSKESDKAIEKVDVEKKTSEVEKPEKHEETAGLVDIEKKTTDLEKSEKHEEVAEQITLEEKTSDLIKLEELEKPIEKVDVEKEVTLPEKEVTVPERSEEQEKTVEKADSEKKTAGLEHLEEQEKSTQKTDVIKIIEAEKIIHDELEKEIDEKIDEDEKPRAEQSSEKIMKEDVKEKDRKENFKEDTVDQSTEKDAKHEDETETAMKPVEKTAKELIEDRKETKEEVELSTDKLTEDTGKKEVEKEKIKPSEAEKQHVEDKSTDTLVEKEDEKKEMKEDDATKDVIEESDKVDKKDKVDKVDKEDKEQLPDKTTEEVSKKEDDTKGLPAIEQEVDSKVEKLSNNLVEEKIEKDIFVKEDKKEDTEKDFIQEPTEKLSDSELKKDTDKQTVLKDEKEPVEEEIKEEAVVQKEEVTKDRKEDAEDKVQKHLDEPVIIVVSKEPTTTDDVTKHIKQTEKLPEAATEEKKDEKIVSEKESELKIEDTPKDKVAEIKAETESKTEDAKADELKLADESDEHKDAEKRHEKQETCELQKDSSEKVELEKLEEFSEKLEKVEMVSLDEALKEKTSKELEEAAKIKDLQKTDIKTEMKEKEVEEIVEDLKKEKVSTLEKESKVVLETVIKNEIKKTEDEQKDDVEEKIVAIEKELVAVMSDEVKETDIEKDKGIIEIKGQVDEILPPVLDSKHIDSKRKDIEDELTKAHKEDASEISDKIKDSVQTKDSEVETKKDESKDVQDTKVSEQEKTLKKDLDGEELVKKIESETKEVKTSKEEIGDQQQKDEVKDGELQKAEEILKPDGEKTDVIKNVSKPAEELVKDKDDIDKIVDKVLDSSEKPVDDKTELKAESTDSDVKQLDTIKIDKTADSISITKENETVKDQQKDEKLDVKEKVADKVQFDKQKVDDKQLLQKADTKILDQESKTVEELKTGKDEIEEKGKEDITNEDKDNEQEKQKDSEDKRIVEKTIVTKTETLETLCKDKITTVEEKDIDTKEVKVDEIMIDKKTDSEGLKEDTSGKFEELKKEVTEKTIQQETQSKLEFAEEKVHKTDLAAEDEHKQQSTVDSKDQHQEKDEVCTEKLLREESSKDSEDVSKEKVEIPQAVKKEGETVKLEDETKELKPESKDTAKDDIVVSADQTAKLEHVSALPEKLESKLLPATVEEKTAQEEEKDSVESKTAIESFREDSLEISKIDKKLQELKEAADVEKKEAISDTYQEQSVKSESQSKNEIDVVDKIDLGRKSPKEREQDVAKIVASVAEVLKSDAPLEEFEGKIPLEISSFSQYAPYSTELRETHITTVESPVSEHIIDKIQMRPIEEEKSSPRDSISVFLEEERKIAPLHTNYDNLEKAESRVSSLLKDSTELIQATSKIISDIKQSSKTDSTDKATEETKEPSLDEPIKDTKSVPVTVKEAEIIEGKSSVLESSISEIDETKKLGLQDDVSKSSVESKTEILDETEKCDIKLDSSVIVEDKTKIEARDLVNNADKSDSNLGKISPKPEEPSKDSLSIEKSQVSSGKSSPTIDDATCKSRSLSPELKSDIKEIEKSEKECTEEKSAETENIPSGIKQSDKSPVSSGKVSPELPRLDKHEDEATEKTDLEKEVKSSEKIPSDVKESTKASESAVDSKGIALEEKSVPEKVSLESKDGEKSIDNEKEKLDIGKAEKELSDIKASSKVIESTTELERLSSDVKEITKDTISEKVSPEKHVMSSDKVASQVKEVTEKAVEIKKSPEIKEKSDRGTEDCKTGSDATKTTDSEKVAPQFKETISSETVTGSLEATPVTSGKATPEIKEPVTDAVKDADKSGKASPDVEKKSPSLSGKASPEVLIKNGLTTDTSSVVSGKSTPEILEPTKHTLDITKSPMLSGRSTPDIVIEEDTGSVISGRSTPDVDVCIDKQKDQTTTDKGCVATEAIKQIETKSPDTEKQSPELKDKDSLMESKEIISEDKDHVEKTKTSVVDKSPVTSGKTSPDVHNIEKETKTESSELGTKVIEASRTLSTSEKSISEIKEIPIASDKVVPDVKAKDENDVKSETSTLKEKDVPKMSTESKSDQLSSEYTAKLECLAGPSGSSKDSISERLTPSKSPTEELDYSRKSTPDIADIEKSKELEEPRLGRNTPPTVPVSPVVKEKLPALHEQEKSDKKDIPEVSTIRSTEVRSSTPASDDCDISSGQVSRVLTTEEEDEKQYSDDEDLPGSPLSATSQIAHSISSQYDLEESVRGLPPIDPMSTSFYGALPDDPVDLSKSAKVGEADIDFDKALQEHRQTRGTDLSSASSVSPSHVYELTTAKYSSLTLQERDEKQKTSPAPTKREDIMTSSFIGTELPTDSKDDPIATWGKPLGLPSPAPINDNKGTPKKERRIPPNVMAKNKLNEDKKLSDSKYDKKGKKITPVYVDLTYVPHHGNSNYSYVDFFKRVRARYYVFSGVEPSKEVYNALLEAKQTWDDKELEVTIIPTYDTDVLGYWVAENEDLLAKHKIDLSPSASRCTINLQDHETSCSAYRLEFS